MFRGTDIRNVDAEFELVDVLLAEGARLLCHGELFRSTVPSGANRDRFFRMENVHVRQPVMVHVGIVHRRLNEFTD